MAGAGACTTRAIANAAVPSRSSLASLGSPLRFAQVWMTSPTTRRIRTPDSIRFRRRRLARVDFEPAVIRTHRSALGPRRDLNRAVRPDRSRSTGIESLGLSFRGSLGPRTSSRTRPAPGAAPFAPKLLGHQIAPARVRRLSFGQTRPSQAQVEERSHHRRSPVPIPQADLPSCRACRSLSVRRLSVLQDRLRTDPRRLTMPEFGGPSSVNFAAHQSSCRRATAPVGKVR